MIAKHKTEDSTSQEENRLVALIQERLHIQFSPTRQVTPVSETNINTYSGNMQAPTQMAEVGGAGGVATFASTATIVPSSGSIGMGNAPSQSGIASDHNLPDASVAKGDNPGEGDGDQVEAVVSVPRGPSTLTTTGRLSHGIKPDIQNVVATTNLDVQLDLKCIALRARNAEYNPKRFAAVIMRIRDPKTTALIFSSGKIVVTGAKSEKDSSRASRKYAKIVHKLGYDKAKFKEFTVQNIVASCDVHFPVCLEALSYSHNNFCSYEPELFPGLIYRMIKPKIVLLIFVSGKVVLTGAKVREDIYEAFDNIYAVLQAFRKKKE